MFNRLQSYSVEDADNADAGAAQSSDDDVVDSSPYLDAIIHEPDIEPPYSLVRPRQLS